MDAIDAACDGAFVARWIRGSAAALHAERDFLTQLDAAIGDADHGVNMDRGFTNALDRLDGHEAASVGDVLVRTGSTLVSKVGGAAGPLYGTAFRAMGKALPEEAPDAAALGKALRAGLEGLQKLGAAVPGDKTIVDAYAPAVAAYDKELASGGDLAAAAAAAALSIVLWSRNQAIGIIASAPRLTRTRVRWSCPGGGSP